MESGGFFKIILVLVIIAGRGDKLDVVGIEFDGLVYHIVVDAEP